MRELSATVAVLVQMLEERGGLDVAACRHRAGMIMEDAILAVGGYARRDAVTIVLLGVLSCALVVGMQHYVTR